jgi:hypothetical protein
LISWNTDIVNDSHCPESETRLKAIATQKLEVAFTDNNFHFSLHPNPISGNILKISFSQMQDHPISLLIYDLLGREVEHREVAAGILESEIDIQDLAEGFYHMRMFSEGKVYTSEFIKN